MSVVRHVNSVEGTDLPALLAHEEDHESGDDETPDAKLSAKTLNPNVQKMVYAVRGAIVARAAELETDLAAGKDLPFKEIVYCNVGNPQALKQKPLTFARQVIALCNYPEMIDNPAAKSMFAEDALARAKLFMQKNPAGTGAYSHSQGVLHLRELVASHIERRDGHPSDPNNIFMTDGASPAVQMILNSLFRDETDGLMIPIPQYPLYSASCALYSGSPVEYYLDESKGWSLTVEELERAYKDGVAKGKTIRGLAVINPGNPTGSLLSWDEMKAVVAFCDRKKIALLADEVYQENIYGTDLVWHSFKKVAAETKSKCAVISFHSCSKGMYGECGKRGGYMELFNVPADVKAELYKLASVRLCPNVDGQLMVSLMCSEPKPGDASYETFRAEKDAIFQSLRRRADVVFKALNDMPGITCQPTTASLYAFPTVTLPPAAVVLAKERGVAADFMYAQQLLESTGMVVVPGSGFGQKDGTFHFRTTFLPQEDKIEGCMKRMGDFHKAFVAKYTK